MSDINVQTFSGKVNITSNLLVGTSHFFVDTTNNRVGITTASPSASLDVNGDVNVGTNITFGGVLTGNGSGLTSVNSDSGLWAGAGTGSVYLSTSTDNVGIGTTNPGAPLDVFAPVASGTQRTALKLTTPESTTGTGCNLDFFQNTANVGRLASVYEAAGQLGMSFSTWNSGLGERVRIDASGNVGIGTTDPDAKLHVNGGDFKISAAGGGGLYDNNYQWLECDNDASWYRLARTAKTNGIACYNGIAINQEGGLVVGSWDSPNALGVGNGKFTGTVTASTFSTTSQLYLGTSASIRQSSSAWTGDPGSGVGKIEYHSNRWYIVAGSNSTELLRVRRNDTDKFFITNDGDLGRTSHSTGYMLGSYNSVGPNSGYSNPIYTIGSNYRPTDTSLGNMYGIGYSHGNFTSILTGGWGMYVASDGDARIGLNGSSGHIKCTGYVDAGTEVYCQNWIRTRGNSGHYWESTSSGHGWHIYPKDRADMYMRTGSGNGGLAFCIANDTVRGYIHCTTSNEIGFLNSARSWSLRMDNSKNCQVYGSLTASAITCYNASDSSVSQISAYGSNQGTGRLYVGQSGSYGGGIEYNGDNSPASTGAGADYITLYRVSNGTYEWTARNLYNNNDWEFRGEVFCNGGWFRTFNDKGWYSSTYGGGWHMTDSTWVRAYNSKGVYVNNQIRMASLRALGGTFASRLDWPNSGHHVDCYHNLSGHVFHINHYAQQAVYLNRTAYSDRRIKEDIKDIDDVSALNVLRKIKPKTYKYKLQPHKGTVYGFIAQDVREVLPYATNLTKLSAPFDREKFVNATILENGVVNLDKPCNELEIGKNAYFYYESSTSTRDFEVTEITSPTQFRVRIDDGGSEWIGNTILVGKEVDDFHGIDKDAIFTVATAALQEVDRQLQTEKARTYELQQKVELLEMSHASLIQRIEALEKL